MKSFLILLPLLGALVLADDKCECPYVKCPGDDAVKLCNCFNSRETICKNHCPDYVPTYRPCPASPIPAPTTTIPPIATSTPSKPTCTCKPMYCPQIWPESCHCDNSNKMDCFNKCGGALPTLQTCPETPTLVTVPTKKPTKTVKTIKTASPTATHAICGGGRANYRQCDDGYTCIKEPGSVGCGPACDGLGICVKDKMCGGFVGIRCGSGQTCVDDPRDDCDPKNGGADCGGLCVLDAYVHGQ